MSSLTNWHNTALNTYSFTQSVLNLSGAPNRNLRVHHEIEASINQDVSEMWNIRKYTFLFSSIGQRRSSPRRRPATRASFWASPAPGPPASPASPSPQAPPTLALNRWPASTVSWRSRAAFRGRPPFRGPMCRFSRIIVDSTNGSRTYFGRSRGRRTSVAQFRIESTATRALPHHSFSSKNKVFGAGEFLKLWAGFVQNSPSNRPRFSVATEEL